MSQLTFFLNHQETRSIGSVRVKCYKLHLGDHSSIVVPLKLPFKLHTSTSIVKEIGNIVMQLQNVRRQVVV